MTIARRSLGSLLLVVALLPTDAWAGTPKPAPGRAGALSLDQNAAGDVTGFTPQRPRGVPRDNKAGGGKAPAIGSIAYPNVAFRVGATASSELMDWVSASLQSSFVRKSGRIVVGDRRHEFTNALVTKLELPTLDVSSTAEVFFAIELVPESTDTRSVASSNGPPHAVDGFAPNAVSVALDGIDTKGVRRIDRITVEHVVVNANTKHASVRQTDISAVSLYVRSDDAGDFLAWHEQFVVQGIAVPKPRKTGTITYFTTDGQPAMTVQLAGVGITTVQDYVLDDEPVVKVDLFVDSLALVRPKGAEGVGAPGSKGRRRPARRGR